MKKNSYIAFSDESMHNINRFRGIGLTSLNYSNYQSIKKDLKIILSDSNVNEFKWEKLKNAKYRFAAEKIIDYCMTCLLNQIIRIDVLIWDISDSRHSIQGRDDIQNLQRMYFHLFENVLKNRWPQNSEWFLFPDENSAINWNEISLYLDEKDTSFQYQPELGKFYIRFIRNYNLKIIREVSSLLNPIVQISDLFVGMGVCSHNYFQEYMQFSQNKSGQEGLFDNPINDFSNKKKEQFNVICSIKEMCNKNKLGVSLESSSGLLTRNPRNPLNYWLYKPQGNYDNAPT